MFNFEEGYKSEFLDQDTAVMQAMALTDRGLFDTDDSRDEDLAALYDH